jgi:hypothetical protein
MLRARRHELLTGQEWGPGIARGAIAEIVADAGPAPGRLRPPLRRVPEGGHFCSLSLGAPG